MRWVSMTIAVVLAILSTAAGMRIEKNLAGTRLVEAGIEMRCNKVDEKQVCVVVAKDGKTSLIFVECDGKFSMRCRKVW